MEKAGENKSEVIMSETTNKYINPEELLSVEYEYIAQTASQANEDRATVVSFFLIAVGSPLAALFSTNLISGDITDFTFPYFLFSGLFFFLTLLSTTTILQLARLRAAWYESMLAMNHMKEFLIQNTELDVSGAFRWRMTTAPAKFKVNSVNFYQVIEVAILSGLLFGLCIFFMLIGLNVPNSIIVLCVSVILGALNIWFQVELFRRFVLK